MTVSPNQIIIGINNIVAFVLSGILDDARFHEIK